MKKLFLASLAVCSSLSFAAVNDNVLLVNVPQAPNTKARSQPLQVAVIPLKMSPALREMQKARSVESRKVTRDVDPLPNRVDLGMNGVPIFDQGQFGTCVTFALTAAIDAALNKKDYISQICLLQLSSYLSDYSYWSNAWNGSIAHRTISQIREYGIITKADEAKGVCNNITKYPFDYNEAITQHKMSLSNYKRYSRNVLSNDAETAAIEPHTLFKLSNIYDYGRLDRYVTISNNSDGWISPTESLAKVRKSLSEGNRVVISFLLKTDHLFQGQNKVPLDTWFASKDLVSAFSDQRLVTQEDANQWGYHEILLYGYDDNVSVKNTNGETQQGVFFVRNSWGTRVPDKGVEFMTYDYFKMMVLDAYSFNTAKKT